MQLDPRGVDYTLFETPTEEYCLPTPTAGPASPSLAPPIALLQRLLQERQYDDALRSLDQLQTLQTPLQTPLIEYVLAARHCAAIGHPEHALRWLALAPHASQLVADARAGRWHFDQTLHWLTNHPAALLRASVLASAKGYLSALTTGTTTLFRTAAWDPGEGPAALWVRLTTPYAPIDPTARGRQLARLYNRAVRAMVHGGHAEDAYAWLQAPPPSPSHANVPVLDTITEALLREARGAHHPSTPSSSRETERRAVDRRIADALQAGDLAHARHVLLRAAVAPGVETLATFLAHAQRHTAIDVPRDPRRRGAVPTGVFLRPVRTAMQRKARALFDAALLRAREKEHDWHGTLRVFQRRFQPVQGLDDALLQAAERIPHTVPQASHAGVSWKNSSARRSEARSVRLRHLASPYAVACALRALVALCAQDLALIKRLYAHCVRHLAPQHLSVRVFEALIPAWSAAEPHAFVQPDGGMRVVLQDMRAAGCVPRERTWTLLLQALVRDGSHASWALVRVLLRRMSGLPPPAAPLSGAVDDAPLPAATPAMYAGVLQALHIVPGMRCERAREVRNWLRASPLDWVADAAAHAPLAEQLTKLKSTEC